MTTDLRSTNGTSHGLRDSGARKINDNGFMREPDDVRPDYTWLEADGLDQVPGELIRRIAEHYYRGGLKYAPNNWKKGTDPESLERNRRSLGRHIVAWYRGETDEDHLAAICWNLITYEINKRVAEAELRGNPLLD